MTEKRLSMQASVIWNSIGSIFYLGCQWLITVLVVRLSGLEAAGVLSLAMSACNVWYSLAVYGMRNFQVSDTRNQYPTGTYLFSRILTCLLALLGCLLYMVVIPYSFYQKCCILLYFTFKISEIFFDVYAGIYQKNWRLDYAGKSLITRGVLSLATFTLVLHMTDDMVFTLACMAAVCLLVVLCYDVPRARHLDTITPDTNLSRVRALLVECFPLVVYTMLSTAIATIPRLFMERILGDFHLGVYGSVATPTLIIQMGATYVFNPFVTLFAERYYQKAGRQFMQALKGCVLAVAGIAVAGVIGGKLLGRWGLLLLYGEEVAAYEELLIPLIICTVLTAFAWLLCGVLTAVRGFKGLVAANLAAVVVSAILSPVLELQYGMQGASLALGVATVVEIAVLGVALGRKIRSNFA